MEVKGSQGIKPKPKKPMSPLEEEARAVEEQKKQEKKEKIKRGESLFEPGSKQDKMNKIVRLTLETTDRELDETGKWTGSPTGIRVGLDTLQNAMNENK